MTMIRKLGLSALALLNLAVLPARAQTNCNNLPTQFSGGEFPTGDFFSNFNNPCYLVPIPGSSGSHGQSGDLNAVYNRLYFRVDPQYQLIIIGTFPNARYFSVTLYDAHAAISQTVLDTNITPLTSQYINPFQPGVTFVPGQQYAVPVNFGGTPGTLETGCTISSGYNVDVNALDGTQRHPGMDWNWDAGIFQADPAFPVHVHDTPQHTNPNTAGSIMIRTYLDIDAAGDVPTPGVIVRDVATGCAYPASYATNVLQIVTNNATTGNAWLDTNQIHAHNFYEDSYLPKLCYMVDPQNLLWLRGSEYVPGADPGSSYIKTDVPANLPVTLAAAGEVMRIRARMATTPPTPCSSGCARTGNEQLRYMSLSFQASGGNTLASIADNAFTEDPAGYVTLIVGTGASIPSWITPSNGYTYLDLTAVPGYQQLSALEIRNILPSSTFNCSGAVVPFNTGAYSPAGGLMGEYLPVVDYPVASTLLPLAVPLVRPNSCGIFPNGQAGSAPTCGLTPSPADTIQTVTTQCDAPGCNQVMAQSSPPITITGAGFGNFPSGLPFTGDSNYLEVADTTQNWDAGYGSDACNVAITGWYYGSIQLVPNSSQNGMCPLQPGDQLAIKVWNPQSPSRPASVTTMTVGYAFAFSSSTLSFGNVLVGASATLTETITNNGSAALQVTGVTTSGPYTYGNNCTAPLNTGDSCSITVTFGPTAAGIANSVLSIANNLGAPLSINLSGTGVGVLLQLSRLSVVGGNSLGPNTITQIDPAPESGETITLTSSDPSVASAPSSVSIAPGATSSPPFTIVTTGVASTVPITLTATYSGVATVAVFNVNAASLSVLNLSPASITSGLTSHYNAVTLTGAAPPAGAVVSLSSADPGVASVPDSVTIAPNARYANFSITAGNVAAPTPVVLTATYAGVTLMATLTVNPVVLTSLHLSPSTIVGGDVPNQPYNVAVLNAPAPPGGITVTLSSANPAVASVPASVTVAAGNTNSASFPITTTPVAATTPVTISAFYNGVTQSAVLTVTPAAVYAVKLSQSSVTGGQSLASNQVQLNGPAPSGGATISLSSSNPAVAAVPATVIVTAGAKISKYFTITTTTVSSSTPVTISATYQGSTQSATLTVTP
jgi:HYDIN/CFA65/VesB-like, Ig-like domain